MSRVSQKKSVKADHSDVGTKYMFDQGTTRFSPENHFRTLILQYPTWPLLFLYLLFCHADPVVDFAQLAYICRIGAKILGSE